MKKSLFLSIVLILLGAALALAESTYDSVILDSAAELVATIVAFAGSIYLFRIARQTDGPLLKKGFLYCAIGVMLLGLSYAWLAAGEMYSVEDLAITELPFEILTLLGICFITAGPISISSEISGIVQKWKK